MVSHVYYSISESEMPGMGGASGAGSGSGQGSASISKYQINMVLNMVIIIECTDVLQFLFKFQNGNVSSNYQQVWHETGL